MKKQKPKGAKCITTMRRVMLLVLVVALFASMTACSGIKDKIPGKYSYYGDLFTFYSDGTYEEYGEYGTGKWTLLEGNVLKLTDFYGETKTLDIEKVTSEGIVLKDGYVLKRQG